MSSEVTLEADYVIVGAGACGMAVADVLLSESDATIALIDRNATPGGHWGYAYPFVRLHQPSSFYGVPSRPLGSGRLDTVGRNAGLFELASGPEVVAYYDAVLREQFLPSGRVEFLPMHEVNGDVATSRLSGQRTRLVARTKVVDAHYLGSVVPTMPEHVRSYAVNDARVVTPTELARSGADRDAFVVLGAGKTSSDVVTWMLDQGVAPDAIIWVRPRDAWYLNRAVVQPSARFARETFGGYLAMLEAAGAASSSTDLAHRYEASGVFLRIDENVEPTLYRGATISAAEVTELRAVQRVVRRGHVRAVSDGALQFDDGEETVPRSATFIDCTAEGLRRRPPVPIYEPGLMTPQYAVNAGQVTWSSALAAAVEVFCTIDDERNFRLAPVPLTSAISDLPQMFLLEIINQSRWSEVPALQAWIDRCRLSPSMEAQRDMDLTEPVMVDLVTRIFTALEPARENLERLVQDSR